MKKLLLMTFILPVLLVSCKKTYNPVAVFHTDTVEPEVGQSVLFVNDSRDASAFRWDFGDGYISNVANPVHTFNSTGTYEVKLTAISKNNIEDKASLIITVTIPTLLEVEVLEYFNHTVVPNASIILYPTLADWDNQTNSILEGFTDQYGIAVFAGLSNTDHYVDVWEQNYDNYALRAEDPEFIHVLEVIPHQINRFTAYVDYVQHETGASKGTRSPVIRKLVKRVADVQLQSVMSTGENWQELYKKSIH